MIAAPSRADGIVRQARPVGAVAAEGGALPPVALPGTEPFLRELAEALPRLQRLPPPADLPWTTLDDRIGGDVAAWIDGLGAAGPDGGVWLIGLGEGGLAALCAAALWPEAVAGLVLVATPVDFHPASRRPWPGRPWPGRPWPGRISPGPPDPFADRHASEAVGRFVGCWRLAAGRWSGTRFRHETPPRQVPVLSRPDEVGRSSPDGLAANGFATNGLAADWLSSFHVANGLMTGTLTIDGVPVDLGRVTAPVLNIVPGPSVPASHRCRALAFVVGSRDYEEVAPFDAGDLLDGPARRAIVLGRLTEWLARQEAGVR